MKYTRLGQIFYGTGIVAYGLQQIIVGDYRPAIIPEWPLWPHTLVLVYVTGAFLVTAGLAVTGLLKLSEKMLYFISLCLGIYFLVLILAFHVPNRLLISENSPKHLGLWTDALKELAFSGGGFVMAGSFNVGSNNEYHLSKPFSKNLILVGRILFSVMLISFGLDHIYYTEFVETLVPGWLGVPTFWTYAGAFALIGAGAAIILGLKIRAVSFLLAAKKEYAVEAFELNVADYIVKPVTPSRFVQAIDKARTMLQSNTEEYNLDDDEFIFIRDSNIIRRLKLDDILFAEAMGDYVKLFTPHKFYAIHTTLKAVEERLPTSKFVRVHRSYVVALSKIDTIQDGALVIDGKPVPVADAYRASLNKRMNIL